MKARILSTPANGNRNSAWSSLMAAVYLQAIADALSENDRQALEACRWLLTDGGLFVDALGLPISPLQIFKQKRASLNKFLRGHYASV